MKLYKILLLIACLVFLSHAPAVLAKKLAPSKINSLQPIPVNVVPNISHNANSNPIEIQPDQNPANQSAPENQSPLDNLLTKIPTAKNNNLMIFAAIAVVLLIIFLFFLYFKK